MKHKRVLLGSIDSPVREKELALVSKTWLGRMAEMEPKV